jgi:hypothetical protein
LGKIIIVDHLLRSGQGRPVSQVTEDFLGWACERLAAETIERVWACDGCEQFPPLARQLN